MCACILRGREWTRERDGNLGMEGSKRGGRRRDQTLDLFSATGSYLDLIYANGTES